MLRVDEVDREDACLGTDPVEIQPGVGLVIGGGLRFGGEDQAVVVLGHIDDVALRKEPPTVRGVPHCVE